MSRLSNITVQNRLLGAFIIISLVGVVTAALNIYNVIQMDEEVHQITQKFNELTDIEEAQVNFLEQELTSKDYLLTDDTYYLHKFDEYNALSDHFMREALLYAATSQEVAAINALNHEFAIYQDLHNQTVAAFQAGDFDEALRLTTEQIDLEVARVHQRVEDILRERRAEVFTEVGRIDRLVQVSILIGVFSLGIFSVLALLASTTTGQVAEPILHLTNAVVAFENGAYHSDMLSGIADRKDEIGQLAMAFDRMVQTIEESDRSKDRMLSATRRFVPYEYLDFLQRRSITDIRLGDHVSAEMAVMFSDIRSFTTISERMTPQENFDFVNVYLSRVSPVIKDHDGFIVKFLGDGMMAIFPYGVDCAVQAAIGKIEEVRRFNADRIMDGLPPVDVGVGIHTGHMMVGMIGESDRMQGDAFSDNVNLTSRIEGLTKYYGVSLIISEETYMRLGNPGQYQIRFLGRVQVKGRERPIALYEVFDADPEEQQSLKRETLDDFNRGVDHYLAGRFAEAEGCFRKVQTANPEDKTTTFYLGRSLTYVTEGAPSGWNGVEIMTSK